MKGILGYHGQGPSANANNSDYEVIDDFLAYSCDFDGTMEPMNIHDAWIKANAFYSHFMDDTLPCGLIVKENYDQEDLYTSIISNEEVHCDYIYRYTAKLKKLVGNLGVVDYDYELILPTALNAISSYYDISIDDAEEMIDDEVLIIDRETFSAEGSYISNEVEEYIFNISSGNNISSYNVDTDENNRIFIRYNSRTNNVEEF